MLRAESLGTVRVPRELLEVKGTVLEEYVRSRLLQFARGYTLRLKKLLPQVSPGLLESVAKETFDILPSPDYGQVPVELLDLQLVFRHDCMALGCNEAHCVLCQHNSQRRCSVNFNRKYLVGDRLLAKCGAAIRIEVLNRATGKLHDCELPGVHLELFTLDGAAYDSRLLSDAGRAQLSSKGTEAVDAELDACALLKNNKQQPLLAAHSGGQVDEAGRLVTGIQGGRLVLPELYLTDSSEALLSGRKPPFRLLVRARHVDGRKLSIRHAVSEPFVVATRRVRASHKVEIPAMDDPVSKLEHMGRETVKKLADLQAAAAQAGVVLAGLEPHISRVEKVGDFCALVNRAEVDGHLRSQLQALLKLPKEKWDEAADHARKAVVPDSRMRAWLPQTAATAAARHGVYLGLLFPCKLGVADIKRPVGLLQVFDPPGVGVGVRQVEVVPQQRQSSAQRDVVRQMIPQAETSWWVPGHAGWTVLPLETDAYVAKSTKSLKFDLSLFEAPSVPSTRHPQPQLATKGLVPSLPTSAEQAVPSLTNMALQQHQGLIPCRAPAGDDAASGMQDWLPGRMPLLRSPFGAAALNPGPVADTPAAGSTAGMPVASQQCQGLQPPSLEGISALLQLAVGEPTSLSQTATQQQQAAAATPTSPPAAGPTGDDIDVGNNIHVSSSAQAGHESVGLPSAVQLEQMMLQRTLTEDVVAAIAAAYEANQCPPDLMEVLHRQMVMEQQEGVVTAAVRTSAIAQKVNVNQQQQQQQQASLVSGLKRTYSAIFAGAEGSQLGGSIVQPAAAATTQMAASAKDTVAPGPAGAATVSQRCTVTPPVSPFHRQQHPASDGDVMPPAAATESTRDVVFAGIASVDDGVVANAGSADTRPAAKAESAAAATDSTASAAVGDKSTGCVNGSMRDRSLDLNGLRNMWPSIQLDALIASARTATTTAAAAAAATNQGKDSLQVADHSIVLQPAPPLDVRVDPQVSVQMSLGPASSLLAMLEPLQQQQSLQAATAGPDEVGIDPLASSTAAAAAALTAAGSGFGSHLLASGSLPGLGDWLEVLRSRQGQQGLMGLHSMSLELPSILLHGANSIGMQDIAAVDVVGVTGSDQAGQDQMQIDQNGVGDVQGHDAADKTSVLACPSIGKDSG